MPAGGPDQIVVVPGCAATCTYVAWLREQARPPAIQAETPEPSTDGER